MSRLKFALVSAAHIVLATAVVPLSLPLLGGLRVENRVSPLAVVAPAPRFSWQSSGAQLTWRVTVTRTQETSPCWDSGTVNSTQQVVAAGFPHSPDTDFDWTVQVTLVGVGGLLEASSSFSTAPAPVGGAWVGGFPQLRSSWTLDGAAPTRARLHVTGVGCYHVFMNGRRLSQELSPGFGYAPNVRVPYDSYDVLPLVAAGGENVLGLRLGTCKYGYLGSYCNGTALECNAGWAMLTVTQEGGNSTTVTTREGWVGAPGPITFQHLYHGETYDAREEERGWDAPGFTPRTAWSPALPMRKADLGPLVPSAYAPVVRGSNVTAVTISPVRADGSFVFDFGRNQAGLCTLSVQGPAGTTLSLVHAEILNTDGSVRNTYTTCAFGKISGECSATLGGS